MIFVGGIHGSGKTHFCEEVNKLIKIPSYSASSMIAERKKIIFPSNKLISGIDDNQAYLISAIEELRLSSNRFLLDGHFCLLDNSGQVTRINKNTFINIAPEGILVITESPNVISERIIARDGVRKDISEITVFQNEEIDYAQELAAEMNIPIAIVAGENRLIDGCDFITRVMEVDR